MKLIKLSLIFIFFLSVVSYRQVSDQKTKYFHITGETMGTTFSIKYKGDKNLENEINQELSRVNDELSTYIPTSTISRFNQSDSGIVVPKTDFYINLIKSYDIYKIFDGRYDPTIMPLVNYWGFGYTEHKKVEHIDTALIMHLKNLVGMDKIKIQPIGDDSVFVFKPNKEIQLDFSSIAKGYGVDKIAELINKEGFENYLVEIGGEIYAAGINPKGSKWVIGINTPSENADIADLIEEVEISGYGLATSGNYRNYYESNGKKLSHTINPLTGFPERSNLLSASVIAENCMTADALATAFMVSGLEKSESKLQELKNIEVCFIYANENGEFKIFKSPGFDNKKKIK
ncbi:MAG: FAD:protein FMN transferase [Saprospiraceae bacterium]